MKTYTQYLKKQAVLINNTAYEVYGAVQGGIKQNFFAIHYKYEGGEFVYIKEAGSFDTAIGIYEMYTGSDGWDIVYQIIEEFPEILEMSIEEFNEFISKED